MAGWREKMAPRGKPVTNTHANNRQYRPEGGNRPISHADDLANDGTQIFHVGGAMQQPRGRAVSMREAGLNTTMQGTASHKRGDRNFMGEPISKLLPPGARARGK